MSTTGLSRTIKRLSFLKLSLTTMLSVITVNKGSDITYFSTKEKLEIILIEIKDFILLCKALLKNKNNISIKQPHQRIYIMQFLNRVHDYCSIIEPMAKEFNYETNSK